METGFQSWRVQTDHKSTISKWSTEKPIHAETSLLFRLADPASPNLPTDPFPTLCLLLLLHIVSSLSPPAFALIDSAQLNMAQTCTP